MNKSTISESQLRNIILSERVRFKKRLKKYESC